MVDGEPVEVEVMVMTAEGVVAGPSMVVVAGTKSTAGSRSTK